jgi:hypothetical protein
MTSVDSTDGAYLKTSKNLQVTFFIYPQLRILEVGKNHWKK